MTCPICNGEAMLLGYNPLWDYYWRCRDCGWTFSTPIETKGFPTYDPEEDEDHD